MTFQHATALIEVASCVVSYFNSAVPSRPNPLYVLFKLRGNAELEYYDHR